MKRISPAGFWLVLMLAAALQAGPPPSYHYGEAWWQEYEPDQESCLLLHFGRPAPLKWRAAAQKAKAAQHEKAQKEDPFLEGDSAVPAAKGPSLMEGGELAGAKFAPPEAVASPGQVLDYVQGLAYPLPEGAQITPDGRFGEGLKLSGGPGLKVRADARGGQGPSMECWFRVERLPARPACVLSINNDEGTVVLHPDGRVELCRKRPHGDVDSQLSAEERRAIEARDASLISPQPIQAGQWTHVCVFTQTIVMQGPAPTAPTLKINGEDVAKYMTEAGNGYDFMRGGKAGSDLIIGNNAKGDEPFEGVVDEVRVCRSKREFYRRPSLAWRESAATQPLAAGKPFFRRDGVVFHAPLDNGPAYATARTPGAGITLPEGLQASALAVEGVRGKGWAIDPAAGFPRLDLRGMNAKDGTLELWLRPVNWDNLTGYWSHTPPIKPQLSIVRCFGRDKRDGQVKLFLNATLPRANDLERARPDIDPGHWSHLLIAWPGGDLQRAFVYLNGQWFSRIWRADAAVLENIEPLYAEFGVNDDVAVARGERPVIEVDEIVGYDYCLLDDVERHQAYARWMGPIEPLRAYEAKVTYKASIGRLELEVTPHPEPGHMPVRLAASLRDSAGGALGSSASTPIDSAKPASRVVLYEGKPLAPGAYQIPFVLEGADGSKQVEATIPWKFEPEPWRGNRLGIVDTPPPPWTPIHAEGRQLVTRMTRYELGEDGLVRQILADGAELLQAPIVLQEGGKPMTGAAFKLESATPVAVTWSGRWSGRTCDVAGRFRLEYDGMVRCELRIEPKAPRIEPVAMVVPLKADHATHWMFNEAGRQGAATGVTPAGDGAFLSSRRPAFWGEEARARRESQPAPSWDAWRSWAFLTQIDLNDLSRGLYWFADNGAGWWQSQAVDAQEIIRHGDTVDLVCHLVAEPTAYKPGTPIVFGLLPHPARPLPANYRLLERATPQADPIACSVFDAFRPWPQDPRGERGTMHLYPAADPEKPHDWEASWVKAQNCVPSMRLAKAEGVRSMYLSNFWFGCRAGQYDQWEWRGGPTSQVTHSQSMVDYTCWEMDQWLGRGIFEAVYLDECYEAPSHNVEAGQAIVLPDGSVQPGLTLFGFRRMLQRWRGLFAQHGKAPMILVHQTGSFMYAGTVFADGFLDGENRPVVSFNSPDFIAQVSQQRAEVLQNGGLWGVASFYMPCIWERGFDHKTANPHKRWAWRMARSVNALLAHYEVGYTFPGQGEQVYRDFGSDLLRWGAGDAQVLFHPYWANGPLVRVEGQGRDALVSFYQKPERVLLIASNLKGEPRELRVELDLARLGLGSQPKVQVWDTAWKPAEGDDLPPPGKAAAGPDLEPGVAARNSSAGDLPLDEPREERPAPHFDGKALILPVRARDYLVVSIEPGR